MAEMLKKMSSKTILGRDPKNYIPENDGDTALLYTIYGTATGVRSGESGYGGWISLIGTFEAVRAEDGKIFQGGQAFLPEPMSSMMASRLREMSADSIDFALKVHIKADSELARGYEYIGEPISDPTASDPLEKLRKMAMAALPAPEDKKVNKPAAKTATKK